PSPRVSLDEDDKRPYVSTYTHKPRFCVGDKVYLVITGSREGPYLIASVLSTGNFTLCLENGKSVRNGEEIDAGYVESA
ncbi:uncharacterized protein PG986_011216, partial [Apiospora aurea]